MEGHRVVNLTADSFLSKIFHEVVSAGATNCILIENVTAVGTCHRCDDFFQSGPREKIVVARRILPSLLTPLVQIFKLDPQDSCLESIRTAIDADHPVIVLRLHAMDAKQP